VPHVFLSNLPIGNFPTSLPIGILSTHSWRFIHLKVLLHQKAFLHFYSSSYWQASQCDSFPLLISKTVCFSVCGKITDHFENLMEVISPPFPPHVHMCCVLAHNIGVGFGGEGSWTQVKFLPCLFVITLTPFQVFRLCVCKTDISI
jgi:hypothetical protein